MAGYPTRLASVPNYLRRPKFAAATSIAHDREPQRQLQPTTSPSSTQFSATLSVQFAPSTHHVSRIGLVLAPAHLRQGLPQLPRLHPPCRSHPQVWPQHLPSVLPGEECRHRFC